jgi:replicative DNA helicase
MKIPIGKIPPQNIEAERAILGACLISKDAYPQCRSLITADVFYHDANKTIFLAFERLFSKSNPIDLLSVSTSLRSEKGAKTDIGLEYIVELTEIVSSSANLEYHCRLVLECWMRRLLIEVSVNNSLQAYEFNFDIFDILSKSQRQLNRITEKISQKKSSDISTIAFNIISDLDKIDAGADFVPSGIKSLDDFCQMCAGDLVIIAARPGMGKTSVAVNILLNTIKSGHRGLFFSLEMNERQLVQKLLACDTNIPYWKIREKKTDNYERELLMESYQRLLNAEVKSMVDDGAGITVEAIKAKSITENMKERLSFVIVDYLQFVKLSEGESKEQQIAHISKNLKYLAKELNIPVIALSQLNREVERREGKRPQLSDIRDSGSIEMDADLVIFPYRAEYYNIKEDENGISTENRIEFIIEKNRHGGTGSIFSNCQMDIGKMW